MFKAELNEFLTRELSEDGYSGVKVRVTPSRTEIVIMAAKTQQVLGEKGRRIRELTAMVQKRFNIDAGRIELYAEKVATRALVRCSRIAALQADWRIGCSSSLLWCSPFHYGDRCQGL